MNDNELDEMLNQWKTPAASASLRRRVQAGLPNKPRRWYSVLDAVGWKGMFGGLAAGAAMFLVVVGVASPQSLGIGTSSPVVGYPYFVLSTVTAYADDGSSRIDGEIRSFSYKGTEIVIDEKHPGNPVEEFFKQFHDGIHYALLRFVPGLVMPESAERDAAFAAYVQSGCLEKVKGQVAAGHETILGHATTVVQHIDRDGWRGTEWKAADLGCFTLRWTSEKPLPGGGFRLMSRRDAQFVAQRDGHPWRREL